MNELNTRDPTLYRPWRGCTLAWLNTRGFYSINRHYRHGFPSCAHLWHIFYWLGWTEVDSLQPRMCRLESTLLTGVKSIVVFLTIRFAESSKSFPTFLSLIHWLEGIALSPLSPMHRPRVFSAIQFIVSFGRLPPRNPCYHNETDDISVSQTVQFWQLQSMLTYQCWS